MNISVKTGKKEQSHLCTPIIHALKCCRKFYSSGASLPGFSVYVEINGELPRKSNLYFLYDVFSGTDLRLFFFRIAGLKSNWH